jgi:hypothetical protein
MKLSVKELIYDTQPKRHPTQQPSTIMLIVMLNVIMLNVIMLNVIMLNVIMLNVIMLSAITLSVIRLSVVAPSLPRISKVLLQQMDLLLFIV